MWGGRRGDDRWCYDCTHQDRDGNISTIRHTADHHSQPGSQEKEGTVSLASKYSTRFAAIKYQRLNFNLVLIVLYFLNFFVSHKNVFGKF